MREFKKNLKQITSTKTNDLSVFLKLKNFICRKKRLNFTIKEKNNKMQVTLIVK